ncbi:MAG TPA: G1 family glutamic endopeptidase, partial [Polyangiaceae bacterium]
MTRRVASLVVGAATLGIAACAAPAGPDLLPQPASSPQSQATVTPPVTHRHVEVGVDVDVEVQATPYAECSLGTTEGPAPEKAPGLVTDADGIARFTFRTDDPPTETAHLSLDCVGEDGSAASYPVELAPDDGAHDTPRPIRASHGTPIPPLADLTLPDADLIARGYPPRPAAPESSPEYQGWLRTVSTPRTLVPAHRRARSGGLRHGAPSRFGATSNNWAGVVASTPFSGQGQYWNVQGRWGVPSVNAASLSSMPTYSAAAMWVGLDSNDVWQAGTDSESSIFTRFTFNGAYRFQVQTESAWIEAFPANEYTLPNVTPRIGDQMQVQVWVGDSTGATTFNGNRLSGPDSTMWFLVTDLTNGQTALDTYSIPYQGTLFTGDTAEFIVERP